MIRGRKRKPGARYNCGKLKRDETEREAIEEAVKLCGGNIAKAAAFLGISPSTLYRKQEGWRRR